MYEAVSRSCTLASVYFFFLMIRRPARSTRTDTLFPYTTLFRSRCGRIGLEFRVPGCPADRFRPTNEAGRHRGGALRLKAFGSCACVVSGARQYGVLVRVWPEVSCLYHRMPRPRVKTTDSGPGQKRHRASRSAASRGTDGCEVSF